MQSANLAMYNLSRLVSTMLVSMYLHNLILHYKNKTVISCNLQLQAVMFLGAIIGVVHCEYTDTTFVPWT